MTARKKDVESTPSADGQALPASAGSARVRREIQKAIRLIHTEDDYDGGMTILCALAGVKVEWPDVTPTTLAEIVSQNAD